MAKHVAAGWRWRALAAVLLLSSLLFLYYSKVASLTRIVDQEKTQTYSANAHRLSTARGNGRFSSNNLKLSETVAAGDRPQLSSSHDAITDNIQAHDQLVTKEERRSEKEYKGKHEVKFNKSIMTKHKVSPTIDSQTDVEKRVSPTSLSARKGKSGISRDSSSVRNDAATVSIVSSQTSEDRKSNTTRLAHNNKKGRISFKETPQHGSTTQEKAHAKKINFLSAFNSFIPTDHLNFRALTDKRLLYLQTECQALKLPKRKGRKTVRKKIAVRDLFSTCVAPKGGSTSWYELREKLKQHRFEGNTQAAILSVRHPLSRLTSAYRDKFLNGSPISAYDAAWKNVTRSSQSWRYRWSAYWLPALVSRGDVEPSLWMDKRRHTKAVNMSDVCRSTLISNLAVVKQFERDYRLNMKKYISIFSNVTFSFEDFLRHILWTFDHDIMDHHWAPQSCLCDPCGQHYDYILHLENIGQEARHVFDALGVPQEVQLGSDHDTKKALSVSENGYFDGIDKALMTRLYVLYKNDFNLFGYQY